MDEVKSLRDAKKWFNENSGILCCIKNGKNYLAVSFEEATALYQSGVDPANVHNLLNIIIKLETENEKHEQKIKQARGNLSNDQALICVSEQFNKTKEETIRIIRGAIDNYNSTIQKNNEQIQEIIKHNLDVEPFYIMHRITK